jgi:GNAT superfamily N-acetyltransferase
VLERPRQIFVGDKCPGRSEIATCHQFGKTAIEWAREQGFRRLLLDVGETNARAMALYKRKGFGPTGVVGRLPAPREYVREIQMGLTL